MANFTRKVIEGSFLKLLMERPLSRITVKDIVADCGINRNTFYYYFEDIPKLIEQIVEEGAEEIIQAYPTIENFEDFLEAVIDRVLAKKPAVLHIYHSASRDVYELYLWKVCDHVINAYMTAALHGRKIGEEDMLIMKKYLSSLAFGAFSNWLRSGMTDDIRAILARLSELKKGMLLEMIARCEGSDQP